MGDLLVTLITGCVMAYAVIVIVFRMVDGSLNVAVGFSAIVIVLVLMAMAIQTRDPITPWAILGVSVSLIVFFPFAEGILERSELRSVGAGQMARSFEAMRARSDNYVARFELAQHLYSKGFQPQAIALSQATFEILDKTRDEVSNRSIADMFHKESILLRKWTSSPVESPVTTCPKCGQINRVQDILCSKCHEFYPLLIVSSHDVKAKVFSKLIFGWALIALFVPLSVRLTMSTDGIIRVALTLGTFAIVGLILFWLFKPPRYDKAAFDWN